MSSILFSALIRYFLLSLFQRRFLYLPWSAFFLQLPNKKETREFCSAVSRSTNECSSLGFTFFFTFSFLPFFFLSICVVSSIFNDFGAVCKVSWPARYTIPHCFLLFVILFVFFSHLYWYFLFSIVKFIIIIYLIFFLLTFEFITSSNITQKMLWCLFHLRLL